MNPNTIETLKTWAALLAAMAAMLGGFHIVVTRPILALVKSEFKGLRTEIESEFKVVRLEMTSEFKAIRAEMAAMETRLNQRIDTHLVHR